MLSAPGRDRLLAHLGLAAPPSADLAGLAALQRAWLARIPFEAFAAVLGEYEPLDAERLVDRFVGACRGGYCFEVNGVFALLLESLGFTVERREAVVGDDGLTDHLALVVGVPEGPHLAEVGFGDGPIAPLPLREGATTLGTRTFTLARDGDGWRLTMPPGNHPAGFRFGDATVTWDAFAPHHERLATSPGSGFVRVPVIERPEPDRVLVLRARTFSDGATERVLTDPADYEAVLRDVFGIDTDALGPDRLRRLWERCAPSG